jgi:hypothetical protein
MQKFLNATSYYHGYTNGLYMNDYYNPDDPSTWIGVTWVIPQRQSG